MSRFLPAKAIPVEDVTALHKGPLRHRERRQRHRPAGEPFDADLHGVEVLAKADGVAFVERHHYEKSYCAARFQVGLYRARRRFVRGLSLGAELVGVCAFAEPMQPAAGLRLAPDLDRHQVVSLSRLVLLDHIEGNAESWFVARAFEALQRAKPDVRLVVSYSDPAVRRALDGKPTLPGHVGTVYKALGAVYTGRSEPDTLWLAPDGTAITRRSFSKVRNDELGGPSTYERLVAYGAPRLQLGESAARWIERAMLEGPFRCLRHPGNHRYAWRLDGLPVVGARPVEGAPRRQGLGGLEVVASALPWALGDHPTLARPVGDARVLDLLLEAA